MEEQTVGIEPQSTYELERGKPMPSHNHGVVQANLTGQFLTHQEYRVITELTLDLGSRPYATPDICVYRRAEVDFLHDQIRMTTPPLVTVEIISPTQGWHEIMEHIDRYLDFGVKRCWVLSPPMGSVTIITATGENLTQSSGVVTDPVTGITADLSVVFS